MEYRFSQAADLKRQFRVEVGDQEENPMSSIDAEPSDTGAENALRAKVVPLGLEVVWLDAKSLELPMWSTSELP